MLHACQHQNILLERSLASKLSNTPKMTFILHLQQLQISNKATFHQELVPHSMKKMLFGNILSVKIHFLKSQGIHLESGLVCALNGWTFQKCMKFALFEFWSGYRCDMKIIFGVFDNLDAKLLSNNIFRHHLLYKTS